MAAYHEMAGPQVTVLNDTSTGILMSGNEPKPGWLFRYGVWIRRVLLGVAIAILVVAKAFGIPNNSLTAKYCLFVVIGLGGVCLLLYVVEYLLAVRYRGYWFDHHFK
jgi:hypothetical protein